MPHAVVQFWFDFASTYSGISALRIGREAEKRGLSIEWKPFLLGPIFKAQGWNTSPFGLFPNKGRYMWRDFERRSARFGTPFTRPSAEAMPNFPQNSLAAARLALVGEREGWIAPFSVAVFRAQFAEHKSISDPKVLAAAVAEAGGNPAAAATAMGSDPIKAALRANTEQAQGGGFFGAPTFVVPDGEMFWGDDRLEDALDWAALKGS